MSLLTTFQKVKSSKNFCGHIATGDYELASLTFFKVSESRPLKTLSKDSSGASLFLETQLSDSRVTQTPGVQNLIDSKMVGKKSGLNMSRTLAGPTPTNISANSDPATEINGTLASAAVALANMVFPVPGGP